VWPTRNAYVKPRKVFLVNKDCPDCEDLKVFRVISVRKVHPDLPDLAVISDRRVAWAKRATEAIRAFQDSQVPPEFRDCPAWKVRSVLRA